jgi:hypothetical protein
MGGKREGAGRPKGSLSKSTIEKKTIEKEMTQRILRSANKLINSQMNLAIGAQHLYRIDKVETKKGEYEKKPVLVTNQDEIEAYLAGEYDDEEDRYYYITTRDPENKALDSLFDRVFGKAMSNLNVKGGFSITDLIKKANGDSTGPNESTEDDSS